MTITPTETPRLNSSERSTWQALVVQLEPNDLVVPGQRVTDHLKDHEVDFVVAVEGAGIVCLEVKGGDVWHDGNGWWQKRGGKDKEVETRPPSPRGMLRPKGFHREGSPLDTGPTPVGPRDRPAPHRASR